MKKEYWNRFMEILKTNYQNEDLSINLICQQTGISRMHLHRIIFKETGRSTSHFIRQFRLEKSKVLLVETRKSISEIAYAVGFRDPNYFSRLFGEKYGRSPSRYKELM